MYWYAHRAGRRGASARDRNNDCPIAADALQSCVQALSNELTNGALFAPVTHASQQELRTSLISRTRPRVERFWCIAPSCSNLYRRGQGVAGLLCILAGGARLAQVLRQCQDGSHGGHLGRVKTGSLVRRLAFWVGQDCDDAEYVRSCQTCRRTNAKHGGLRGLLYPLSLPSESRRGGRSRLIRLDWIAGLQTTVSTGSRITSTSCLARRRPSPRA